MKWFDVDTEGLRAVLARRGASFAIYEVISNSWDAPGVSEVRVLLERIPNTGLVRLEVEDDSPNGFARLEDAYTLFAPSSRAADSEKRGRFGMGEKLTLALMERASIVSTTGAVTFDARGRHVSSKRRAKGSMFKGELVLSDIELDECLNAVKQVLPPVGIHTTINGFTLVSRKPVKVVEDTLATDLADSEGRLRPTRRKTRIEIYEVEEGSPPRIYELGIPVVEIDGRYSVSIAQKIPLSFQRDAVPPAYLARIRAIILEAMTDRIDAEDANAAWVREALVAHGDRLPEATIKTVLDLRFGEKRVAYDPTDREANYRAVSEGYTLVTGSQMCKAEWEAAKRVGAIVPAGKLMPTPKASGEGDPREFIGEEKWTPSIRATADLAQRLAPRVIGRSIVVRIANDITWFPAATYGGGVLTFNVGRLGYAWFSGPLESVLDLIVHELGHEDEGNHLSSDYYQALTRIAGKLVVVALTEPKLILKGEQVRLAMAAAA